jgi:ABC-type transporter Mla maintaining outer membrane lipid asymmetry ATPase subunit MlaF
MSSVPLIDFRDAAISHPQNRDSALFRSVNWAVSEGDFWIVGSGHRGGKSSLLSASAALHQLIEGDLWLFGELSREQGQLELVQIRKRIGLVFDQGGRVFHHLSVAENITLPIQYHQNRSYDQALEELDPLIRAVGLGRVLRLPTARLSRGWAWRAACVRALAIRPEVMLFDNPLSGLDREDLRWCRTFINQLATTGVAGVKPSAVVVTCDDLRPWAELGRQFALAAHGKWAVLGDRRAMLDSTEPAVRDLLAQDF